VPKCGRPPPRRRRRRPRLGSHPPAFGGLLQPSRPPATRSPPRPPTWSAPSSPTAWPSCASRTTHPLNDLAGEEFLTEIRRTHEVYLEVLGITKVAPAAQSPVRAERVRELRRLMKRHVVRVLAQLEDDAQSQGMVRQALQPIDDFRAAQARRAVSSAAEEPEAEGPQVGGGVVAPVAPVAAPGNGAAPVAVPGAPNNAPS
jgi:hypothetical protein